MTLDPAYVTIVRRHLRFLGDGDLSPDQPLDELGLDSMGMLALLFDVEDAYGVTIPEDDMLRETFRTARTLWSAVEAVRAG